MIQSKSRNSSLLRIIKHSKENRYILTNSLSLTCVSFSKYYCIQFYYYCHNLIVEILINKWGIEFYIWCFLFWFVDVLHSFIASLMFFHSFSSIYSAKNFLYTYRNSQFKNFLSIFSIQSKQFSSIIFNFFFSSSFIRLT